MIPLFFDIETEPTRHDKAYPDPSIVTLARGDEPPRIFDVEEGRAIVNGWRGPIVGHNVAFDFSCLGCDSSRREVYDTNIRAVLLGAASGLHASASSSLKLIAKRAGYAMPKKDKDLTLSFGGATVESLTPEQREYAMDDIMATRIVWKYQGGLERISRDEERQTQLANDVFHMGRRGVAVDLERVKAMRAEADARTKALRDVVYAHGLIRPAGPKKDPWAKEAVSRKEIQRRLREAGVTKLPKRRSTDEREPSGLLASDAAILRGTGDPGLIAYADYVKANKWGCLVEAFDVGGPIIRAWWKPIVASGRVSCSYPNLTQVPRVGGLRECIVPRPGNKLVIMDFSMLEFRVWAATCQRWLGHSVAAKLLREGKDVHTYFGNLIVGQAGGTPEERRQDAKAMNYGIIGGMSESRLASTLGCTMDEAAELMWLWKWTFTEFGPYRSWLKKRNCGGGKYEVTLPSGRVRRAFMTEILNVVIQGGGADVAKTGLQLNHRSGLPVVSFPHDEYICDVRPEDAEEVGRELCRNAEAAGLQHYPEVPWGGQEFKVVDRWPSKRA